MENTIIQILFEILQEMISTWLLSFLQVKNIPLTSQNPVMTACIIFFSAFFQGTSSTALTVAAADQVEKCPSAVPESVYQTDPKTMQLHIEEAAVTSARGKGKMSGKRMIQISHAELVKEQHAVIQYSFTILLLTAL